MNFVGVMRFLVEMVFGKRGQMPRVGELAPQFSAVDQNGKTVRLLDFRGKRVVLWFYPKADTPG